MNRRPTHRHSLYPGCRLPPAESGEEARMGSKSPDEPDPEDPLAFFD